MLADARHRQMLVRGVEQGEQLLVELPGERDLPGDGLVDARGQGLFVTQDVVVPDGVVLRGGRYLALTAMESEAKAVSPR
ncbi:MAG: hypothetical protein AB2814_09130 [Candidatus Sedimenticola endophacoides]